MKKAMAVMLAVWCSVFSVSAVDRAPAGWTVNYAAALQTAKQQNRQVLILFTGSDWCSWCKRLKKDVLDKKAFKRAVQGRYILVYFDFPADEKKISHNQRGIQQGLAKKFGVQSVPTTVIVDKNGNKIREFRGYADIDTYLEKVAPLAK